MGKVTGFLEFEREDRDYLPVAERIRNYKEFVLPLPEKDIREQAARCMNCGVPYCHGTNAITNMPTGCRFHPRCPYAIPACATAPVELQSVADGQRSRCIRVAELALDGAR